MRHLDPQPNGTTVDCIHTIFIINPISVYKNRIGGFLMAFAVCGFISLLLSLFRLRRFVVSEAFVSLPTPAIDYPSARKAINLADVSRPPLRNYC